MRIREANINDSKQIAKVHVASWKTTYPGQVPDEYLNQLSVPERSKGWEKEFARGENSVLVAEDGRGVLGFVSFGACRDEDVGTHTGEVYALYLLSEVQRSGVGRALWDAAIKGLRDRGLTDVAVWVLDTNSVARCFYERMGYTLDGKSKTDVIGGREVLKLRYKRSIG